jgi:hypothetical protein
MQRSTLFIGATILLLSPLIAGGASAQLINLKTVPVASGDQFLIYPSQNLSMGGVSIALDDPFLDPFVNPARGSRTQGVQLFGSPTFYSITNNNGGARTLPFSLLYGEDDWFGAVSLTLQELRAPDDDFSFGPQPLIFPETGNTLSEGSATNKYFFGMIGHKLSGTDMSIGGSISLADLNAVDGVEHLYALSASIDQYGSVFDVRVGFLNQLSGDRTFEALLLHNRFRMTHDVTYFDFVWDEPVDCCTPTTVRRDERNLDRTDTWGLHMEYTQPLTDTGWRVGGIATANYKSHPKIPNYEIMNIPRDPGHSWAYNLGVGVSRQAGQARFGLDLIYEPIKSSTWAEANIELPTADGGVVTIGSKSIENDFDFSNAIMRVGLSREGERGGLSLGLQVRSTDYQLRQRDNVALTRRTQQEHWLEWTPTWGGVIHFPEFEIRYTGRATLGTGRPGVAWTGLRGATVAQAAAADFIIAPSGPLTLQDASVFTHQVSVTIPIR